LCFVNPVGGNGKAEQIFEKKLKPKLEMVGLKYEKVLT